jgi:hypothetical protein
MKKFGISVLLSAAILGFGLNSCDKDEFSEEDAMNLQSQLDKQRAHEQDSIRIRNQRVSYTVNVVDASTSTLKSGSMVSAVTGAVVKLVQDTMVLTKTVDASGIVTFNNLKPGDANVNITLADYSEVNYTVNLGSWDPNGGSQSSNIIPMVPVSGTSTATISGKVVFESDLTNKTPEAAANIKVLALIDAGSSALAQPGGSIVKISYDKLALNATTDANGNYSLTVPATLNGLKYEIVVPDFTVDQKLLMPTFNLEPASGVITVATSFGKSFVNAASDVEVGNPVIVTIDAPTYAPANATATAVIDNSSSIDYVHNLNVGSYYKQGTFTHEIVNSNPEGSNATLQIVVSANGHANGTITSGGSKFNTTFDASTVEVPYIKTPARAKVTAVVGGKISEYEISANHRGAFYSESNLQLVKHTGVGVGSVTNLPASSTSSGKLRFDLGTVVLANPVGSGYAVGDSLILDVIADKSNTYKGKIYLTGGSVTAINITDQGSGLISGKVDVLISSPENGTTALASATVKDGKISVITIDDAGNGYKTAPTVTINNKAQAIQAKYKCTVTNGQVTGFTSINNGNGYLTVPNVTLESAIPGAGAGAKAHAIIAGGEVTSIVIVNPGNGYRGNTPGTEKQFTGTPTNLQIKGSSSTIVNIDLGTGSRSVEQ